MCCPPLTTAPAPTIFPRTRKNYVGTGVPTPFWYFLFFHPKTVDDRVYHHTNITYIYTACSEFVRLRYIIEIEVGNTRIYLYNSRVIIYSARIVTNCTHKRVHTQRAHIPYVTIFSLISSTPSG